MSVQIPVRDQNENRPDSGVDPSAGTGHQELRRPTKGPETRARSKKGRACITGATAGIGKAVAWELASAGFDLLLVGRRDERLRQLAQDLEASCQISVVTQALDITDAANVQKWANENLADINEVTVLINNAGLALGTDPVQAAKWSDWNAMIDTNVKGLLAVTYSVMPALVANSRLSKNVHIVNLGSVAGRFTYPGGAVYSATKFAVRALSEGFRMDLAGTRIRVTNIEPGMVETEFSEVRFAGDTQKAKAVYRGFEPLTAQDIAETIRWCLERPGHVNIQELLIMPTDQSSVRDVHRSSTAP